jgi:hypothetical protein
VAEEAADRGMQCGPGEHTRAPHITLLSGVAEIPPQGARYDLAFQGPIVGQRRRGTIELTDYIHIRPVGRVQLHIQAEITTEDGKKIALYADGVAHFTEGPPVGDLRENMTVAACTTIRTALPGSRIDPHLRAATRAQIGGQAGSG